MIHEWKLCLRAMVTVFKYFYQTKLGIKMVNILKEDNVRMSS
jgi:hypothetical protein